MTWHWYGVKTILQAVLTKMSDIMTMGSDILVNVGLDYGCWASRHKLIQGWLFTNYTTGMYFIEMLLKCTSFYSWKCIWNAVCKMSALLLWCQRVDESLINSKIGLIEVMAWHQHGVIPVLESVLTKMSNTIGAIRLQWLHVSWLSFVQVMACRLLGTKPFTHPMLTFCQLNPK